MNHPIEEFKTSEGIDLKNDKAVVQRLKEAAEKANIELSSAQDTEINLPFITADANGPKHFVYNLTRSKLDQLVKPLIEHRSHPIPNLSLMPNAKKLRVLLQLPSRMDRDHGGWNWNDEFFKVKQCDAKTWEREWWNRGTAQV